MDLSGFLMSLSVVALGILIAHILEKRSVLGKRQGS